MNQIKKNNLNKVLAVSYGALNLADYITTKKILKEGGIELNPITKILIKYKLFGIAKILSTLAGMYVIYNEETITDSSKFITAFYVPVVTNNVYQIVKHKKSLQQKS